MGYTEHLKEHGWVVIPFLAEEAKSGDLRAELRNAYAHNPEFIDGRKMLEEGEKFQLGGCAFSHVGQHGFFCRNLRSWAHGTVLTKVFGPLLKADPKLQFEQCFDRTMIRRPSQTPGKESFHRDESPGALPTDTIYGGWVNLDPFDQYFSGCPGTHKEVAKNRGFAKIKKSEAKKYKGKQQLITIPPGHIFIFYERMVHEVLPSKKKEDQHRMFLGWRTTYSNEPLVPNVEALIKLQAPMPIKSGQQCTQYSQMHWTNWRQRLSDWSIKNFKPQFLHELTVKSGKEAGKKYTVVHRCMRPLKWPGMEEAGIGHYNEYRDDEVAIMKPGRTFRVLQPGSSITFETISFDFKKASPPKDNVEYDSDSDDSDSDYYDPTAGHSASCACRNCRTSTNWRYNSRGEFVLFCDEEDEVQTTELKKRKASPAKEYVEEGGHMVKRVKVIDLTED